MKQLCNDCITELKPYSLISQKIWSLSEDDLNDVIKLDWNEGTISPSPNVNKRLEEFIKSGKFNWYPDVNRRELLKLLSDYTKLPIDNIQYFSSSDTLHEYIVKVFLEKGKTALILGPTYDNFRLTCESQGSNVEFFLYDDNFKLDNKLFSNKISETKPNLVYICNPNNPTGYLFDLEYIENLITDNQDVIFLIDEAYFEFDGISCQQLISKYNNILISRTFSKAFSLANFRIGYLLSSSLNIELVNKVRNPKNVCSFSQEAAIAVLEDIDYMFDYVNQVKSAKNYFSIQLSKILENIADVHSNAGNFVLLNFKSENIKNDFVNYLELNNILTRSLSFSYDTKYLVRITIGTMSQMEKVVGIIKKRYGKNCFF